MDFSAGLGDWAMAFSNSACEHAASLVAGNLSAWASGGPPVSLIWGEEDTITPLVQARSLERWMPKATVTVLPGVGHIPHIEDPRAFTQGLLSLLRAPSSGVGDTGR